MLLQVGQKGFGNGPAMPIAAQWLHLGSWTLCSQEKLAAMHSGGLQAHLAWLDKEKGLIFQSVLH